MHPSHKHHIGKLNRISGQVNGIKRMIDDQQYCVDIMVQIKAVRNALKSIELHILQTHTQNCLKKACKTQDSQAMQDQINDIVKLLKKYE